MRQYWVAPVPPFSVTDATAYNTSVTLTDVSPTPQVLLPANFLEAGSTVEIHAQGEFSNTATPTLLIGAYFGGVAGVALGATGAITTTTGATAWPWKLFYRGRVRTVGSTGTIKGSGELHLGTSLVVMSVNALPATQAARTVTIDTTTAKTITIGAQWSASSASNTLTCYDIDVRIVS